MTRAVGSALLLLAIGATAANAAPPQLRGKSIVLSWTEQRREQNPVTRQEHHLATPFSFTVYVSSADRTFNRLTAGRAGSSDQGAGSKDRKGFAARAVNFSGQRMTASNTFAAGGARQIAATFDAGFSGCSGSVIIGRGGGREAIRQKKMDGSWVDLLSVSVGAVSCSISAGNALGGE